MDNEDLTLEDIYRMKQEGQLFAELEQRKYVLMAFELYPNGTTSQSFIEDTEVALRIGELTGLGNPDDSLGWAIWYVPTTTKRKDDQ